MNKPFVTLTMIGFMALFGLVGCGAKSKACKVAEQAESEMVSAWREGGLTKEASERARDWATDMESIRHSSDMGPIRTIDDFRKLFAAMQTIQEDLIKQTTTKDVAMRAGEFVPQDNAEAMKVMFLGTPKDGKTPEQRAKEYAPTVAENERKIVAYQKGVAACRKALGKLEGMA